MVNDAAFPEAMSFTFLDPRDLADPVRLAGMALLLNAKLKLGGLFLYIFLLPLAISDLAAGIAWTAIFTELGYLNTISVDRSSSSRSSSSTRRRRRSSCSVSPPRDLALHPRS